MSFFNLYRHHFVRIAVGIPEVRLADPVFNAGQVVDLMTEAAQRKAMLAVFTELGLTGYSCEDLFHQQALLDAGVEALASLVAATRDVPVIGVVGVPLCFENLLFNCAAVFHAGRILGVVPKTYLPNYREFYELRQFTPGDFAPIDKVDVAGQRDIPFGSRLLFRLDKQPLFAFHVEICEDLWVPIPPSSHAALAGATVLLNLSASNVTIGKSDFRRQLVADQSARCIAAYAYAGAGFGESTTDLAWDGHGLIVENGNGIAESTRFSYRRQLVSGDIDLDRLNQDRMRQNSFGQAVHRSREVASFRVVEVAAAPPVDEFLPLARSYERFPYTPSDPATRDQRCRETVEIQVQGLVRRMRAIPVDKVVIGISGGLDSTQALIICARAMDVLGLPRANILAYTMPGFATTARTRDQAQRLMAALGCSAHEIDIRPSCERMLKDIGHPFADGRRVFDVTFENVQAGERTSHLFRLANLHRALVVGTSDLSEVALGWCTYGVGDQMAHYHVNASVPKTLVQHLIRYVARSGELSAAASTVLLDVLGTAISPELVPSQDTAQPAHDTETVIGPFDLQDFFLYYVLRFGYLPPKIAFLAWSAWHDRDAGIWPDIPEHERRQYGIAEIKKWLEVFLRRFFEQSQYKRSAIPNAPKVGSGGSLSPRGDYRAPSDLVAADAWIGQLDAIPDHEPQSD
jgi:NAD+ synthase (glutamine-hydrolysing)